MHLVPDIPSTPPVWLVCFMGVERHYLWDWFLPAGFRHAFLLGYLPDRGCYLCHDVLWARTEITVLSPQRAGFLLSLAHEQGAVLSVPNVPAPRRPWLPRIGFWCVPAILHVLGLGCVAWTPKGLHDYLTRKGAKPLVEKTYEPVQHSEN